MMKSKDELLNEKMKNREESIDRQKQFSGEIMRNSLSNDDKKKILSLEKEILFWRNKFSENQNEYKQEMNVLKNTIAELENVLTENADSQQRPHHEFLPGPNRVYTEYSEGPRFDGQDQFISSPIFERNQLLELENQKL